MEKKNLNLDKKSDFFMKEALKEAKKAYDKEEIPIGAVIVYNNKIIGRGHNTKEKNKNAIKHAEINAIEKASKKIGAWRLIDCDMYVTLEPCMMCTGAILNSRLRKIYIATEDPKTGAIKSKLDLEKEYIINHKIEFEFGIMKNESEKLIKDFFKNLRSKKRGKNEEKKF